MDITSTVTLARSTPLRRSCASRKTDTLVVMETWIMKTLAMLIIFLAIFIPAIIPLKLSVWFLKRGERGQFMLSVIACFGGGAILGVYMLHLVPEVDHLLHEFWLDPAGIDYPMAQLLVGLGFFMLVFIEQGIHALDARRKNTECKDTEVSGGDVATIENGVSEKNPTGSDSISVARAPTTVTDTTLSQSKPRVESAASICTVDSAEDLVREEELEKSANKTDAMKTIILFAALSSDCVFEGLSLGLQGSQAGVWNLVIAILSHEAVIAFMLGLELLKHYTNKQVFWLGFFYAMMNPVGISAGVAIHAYLGCDDVFEVLSGVLEALCGGVFLYVTFIEILAREFAGKNCLVRTSAVFAGYAMIAFLALVPTGALGGGHDHVIESTTEAITAMTQPLST